MAKDDPKESLALLRRVRAVQAATRLQQQALRRFPDGVPAKAVDAEIAAVRQKRAR